MVDSWYGIVVLSGNILCSLSYVLYQEFEARCRGWKKKNVHKSQLWFQLVAMKKLRGKLTRHALNQLVSIFLVKVKRMQFNNIFDKTPVKFIILMKGTKTGFIMGWCKCSRKRCITSCFRFMQLCSHIILFFLSTEIWISLFRCFIFFFFSVIVKAQFIIRHSFRPLFSPDILQNKMQRVLHPSQSNPYQVTICFQHFPQFLWY